jgi:hypothetical protein
MLLQELIQERQFQGCGPAGSVFFGDRFVARRQKPAFPHVSPFETQMVLNAMVQNFVPLILEPRSESISGSSLRAAGKDVTVPCRCDLEIL